jgi:glycerol-3-phosphate acyltransferase PlsY
MSSNPYLIAAYAVSAYALGSIPFGYIAGKINGIDIREHGSGNIGATNVWRVLGKKWGGLVFALDVGKGIGSVMLGRHALAEGGADWVVVAAALCGLLGHIFPVWLKFKGGKAVATSLGTLIGLVPLVSMVLFAFWAVILRVTGYVSLASILAAIVLPLLVLGINLCDCEPNWWTFGYVVVMSALVIVRHRGNIQRLREGTENRFVMGKKGESTSQGASTRP